MLQRLILTVEYKYRYNLRLTFLPSLWDREKIRWKIWRSISTQLTFLLSSSTEKNARRLRRLTPNGHLNEVQTSRVKAGPSKGWRGLISTYLFHTFLESRPVCNPFQMPISHRDIREIANKERTLENGNPSVAQGNKQRPTTLSPRFKNFSPFAFRSCPLLSCSSRESKWIGLKLRC